eukprot:Rmarinus@m.4244
MASVTLVSNDGEYFSVKRESALLSRTIADLLADTDEEGIIPLAEVDSSTLKKVIEFADYRTSTVAHESAVEDDLRHFDKEFMNISSKELYHLTVAANYLYIKPLLDLCCKTVADWIRGKSAESIREILGIENDLTPQEEESIRRESCWCESMT